MFCAADTARNLEVMRRMWNGVIAGAVMICRESSSLPTRRWRRESRANPSLKWGSRAWQYGTIPRGLWMITEAEKAISGSKTAEFQSLPLGSFSCYLDPKLLIILSFLPSAGLAAGEFTVYKKSRSTALSADPAKNLILFSYLESQGAHANLP